MKLKRFLKRIPRPVKVGICIAAMLVVGVLWYISLGCPKFVFEQEFRRAEKTQMVGPSVIVDTVKEGYSEYDEMIVGETDSGICFFGKYHYTIGNKNKEHTGYHFFYTEKTGDMTLVAAPNRSAWNWDFWGFQQDLPVYLFTDTPDAVQAEIKLVFTGTYEDEVGEVTIDQHFHRIFEDEAARSDTGIFRFTLHAQDKADLASLAYLSDVTAGNAYGAIITENVKTATATVRLYDAAGELILEQELDLHHNA